MRTFRTRPAPAVAPPAGPAIRPRLRGLADEVRRYQHTAARPVRPANRRRDAVVVLTALAALAVTHAAFALAIDRLPGVRDPLYADKAVKLRERIAAQPDWPVVVQFGSSRTSNALRGADNAPMNLFNFGVPAAGPVVQGLYLRRWLAEGRRTDLVLLELFPAQLASQVPQPVESHFTNPERFTPDESVAAVAHGFPAATFGGTPGTAPVYTYRLQLLGRVFPAWLPWRNRYDSSRGTDAAGWMKSVYDCPTSDQRAEGIARARAEYGAILQTLRIDGPVGEALRASLELCRARGVRAAVVLMPEGRSFRKLYSADARLRVGDFVRGLERDFGPVVINARAWLDDAAFIDGHHALPDGAAAFTAKLAEHIAPLLRDADAPR
jgi:hypothetical protein